ncbi:MAG: hypothetical protein U9R56_02680, partial [candidate division Zixibacteria bacterium]|nr:hypothetical protein [candidate division Zixibacteria bacterium]
SGEWPRNSDRDYIGEIRYWMGAITASGDTLVANSYDDFEAMPMPISGVNDYKIYLSTDSTRYFDYDMSDTIGFSNGNPSYGWRIWDPTEDQYIYNQIYDALSTSYSAGGPTSLQDSYYRFNDDALGSSLLGIELTHNVMQWNYCYNEDFLFVVLEITNTSTEDYHEFAFGLYVDIDVGGPDGTGENGRLEDMVAFDSTENLAWVYDNVGIDPGWGPTVSTGIMGTKYLETPDNTGMTAFRSDDWAIVTGIDDIGMFELINSQQFDESLPPTDQFYIQCTRGIDLTAGKTVRVVYALIAGSDETDFNNNAAMAQELYNNYFQGPQPPSTPTLEARAGNRKVYLHWDDTAEVAVDPLSGDEDFAGYKLYRSDNQGKTWGVVNYQTGNNCMTIDYTPVALYTVSTAGDPIPHSFVDTGLYNGVEYWYCLAAFDRGDDVTGVDALQSGFGVADQVPNVLAVTPVPGPAGYYDAASTVDHNYTGDGLSSEGTVVPIVFDESRLTGSDYQVVFEDAPEATYWHLINFTNGDTVLTNQTRTSGEANLFEVTEGLRVVVSDGDHIPRGYGQTEFAVSDTTLTVGTFYGPAIAVLTGNDDDVFGGAHFRSTYELRYMPGRADCYHHALGNKPPDDVDDQSRQYYYTDSTRATSIFDGFYGTDTPIWVPFEVWNTTTNRRVSLAVYDFDDNGVWDDYDLLAIVNYPYDAKASVTEFAFPYYYSWLFGFDEEVYSPSSGDVFTIEGAPLNGPEDIFLFKADGVNNNNATSELDDIRVVPNPYFASGSAMVETLEGQSVISFQGIPAECTIRIYSLAGDLVRTIEHVDQSGEARWNLLSSNGQQVASGMYIFHVDSKHGEHLGRFAVIK